MSKQIVHFRDLGVMDYKEAWDYQENLLQQNLMVKKAQIEGAGKGKGTKHHLLFVEHPAVYTLGKSGKMEHVLLTEEERARILKERGLKYDRTN